MKTGNSSIKFNRSLVHRWSVTYGNDSDMALFAGLWGTPFSDLNLYWNDLIHMDTPLNPLVHYQFPKKIVVFYQTLRQKPPFFRSTQSQGPQGSQGSPGIPPGQRHPKWPWPPVWSVERHRSASRPRRGWNSAAPGFGVGDPAVK